MTNNEKGITRFAVIVAICVTVLVSILITQMVLFFNDVNNNTNETIIERFSDTDFDKIVANEIRKNKEVQTETVEELEFTQEYLESGKKAGNVEILLNNYDKSIFLSITGNSNNPINQTDSVSGKNRWYKNIDLTKYSTLEFYARNGKDNGDVMIFIDDTIVERIRYTELPSTWTKYKVNISNYKGEHTVSIAGGYADNTGSVESNTQYCNIKLK